MQKTKVTRRGQTVVPAALRKKFNIGADSHLVWSAEGNRIEVTPLPASPVKVLRGLSEGFSLRKALLKKRSEDKALE